MMRDLWTAIDLQKRGPSSRRMDPREHRLLAVAAEPQTLINEAIDGTVTLETAGHTSLDVPWELILATPRAMSRVELNLAAPRAMSRMRPILAAPRSMSHGR